MYSRNMQLNLPNDRDVDLISITNSTTHVYVGSSLLPFLGLNCTYEAQPYVASSELPVKCAKIDLVVQDINVSHFIHKTM